MSAVRRLLRWLWEYHGAQKLDHLVNRYPGLRPRNVTASDEERAALISAAPPYMRLLIHLCSDLAIRSSTAANMRPENYNTTKRDLRFKTKCGERLTLPVTASIQTLIEQCDPLNPDPFVFQLWSREEHKHGPTPRPNPDGATLRRKFKALRLSVGITRKLTLHDLRRTAAVAMLELTGDIRDVQALLGHRNLGSTIWYIDHDLRPVKRSNLELIKNPAWRKEHTA
jgi:integrase